MKRLCIHETLAHIVAIDVDDGDMAVFPLGLAQAIQLICEDKTIPKNTFEVLVLCELCIGLFRGGKF